MRGKKEGGIMTKSTAEAEQEVYKRMLELNQEFGEDGIQIEEIVRGVAGFLASIVFESTPSSLVLTAFSGVNEDQIEHKVYAGLHTPEPSKTVT